MNKKPGFEHNGSIGKNILLLLRSLTGAAAYGFMWYGFICGNTVYAAAGAAATAVAALLNLFLPLARRS